MLDEATWVEVLHRELAQRAAESARLTAYYDGTQPLSYMNPELAKELGGRIRQVVVNWPRLVVDSLEERLDVEGFRYPMDPAASARLWDWWQANNCDEQSQQVHVESLVTGSSYVIIGAADEPGAAPVITAESSEQVICSIDPRTREVRAALKMWRDWEMMTSYATLYLPNVTVFYRNDTTGGSWAETARDEHQLGVVPVVPFVNRARILNPFGVSELADVLPLSDAANKIATDMMIAAEYHSMPRRWVVGMTEDDFTDANGKPLSKWSSIAGRIWAAESPEAKMGQFQEADLRNFHETLNSLARMTASLSGLPPHFMGFASDNPASADAIRSAESRLVKRAERRQRPWGESWEQVMRIAMLIADGAVPAEALGLETIWRDPSTPTIAQRADAAVKMVGAGITSVRQALEDIGYSQTQIERVLAEVENSAQSDAVTQTSSEQTDTQSTDSTSSDTSSEPATDAADQLDMITISTDSAYTPTPLQVGMYHALEAVVEKAGKFNQTTGNDGAHYVNPSPFAAAGMQCANCYFFEGPRACEIVDGDIAPEAVCKLWIIPEQLLTD